MEYKRRIALIDSDSILYYCTSDKIKYDELGQPIIDDLGNKVKYKYTLEECKANIDSYIKKILDLTNATHYILFVTVGKCFRYQIYPDYKGNRKYLDRSEHFFMMKDYLIEHYKAYYNDNYEADDLCNVTMLRLNKENNGDFAYICSPDKDLLNLVGTAFDYKNFVWINTNPEEAEKQFWVDMIKGQSVDFIKGIPKKGEVFANKLLDIDKEPYAGIVLNEYINYFGEELGIQEFYKNYMCLKIKDHIDIEEELLPVIREYVKDDNEDEDNKLKLKDVF